MDQPSEPINASPQPSSQPTPTDSTTTGSDSTPVTTLPNDQASSLDVPEVAAAADNTSVKHPPNRLRALKAAYLRRKLLFIPLTILAVAAVTMAVPASRYAVLGLFIKQNFAVQVLDATSRKPVASAQVQLGNVQAVTDADGIVHINQNIGKKPISVSKKYYKTTSSIVLIPLGHSDTSLKIYVQATGRQVPLSIVDKISGKGIAGISVKAAGSETKTDKNGAAVIVLPADKATQPVTISADGFNTVVAAIQVSEQVVPQNTFTLVATGKLYFLSKLSGKIDVVKTNLDGTERQTVLAGTGKENTTDTVLLASRDWKYLALKSLRDGGAEAKLFLIDTSSDKVTTMDEGKAVFNAVGWADHRFVYTVYRQGVESWQPKAQALKTYDAADGKLATIDETDGEGTGQNDYVSNQFGSVYILGNEIVYSINWYSYSFQNRIKGKQVSLISVKSDGSAKHVVHDFPVPDNIGYAYINTVPYEPRSLYVRQPTQNGDKTNYFAYEDGKFQTKTDLTDQQYDDGYETYLQSPSGNKTFWGEVRDGKTTLFIGDADGQNSNQIAALSEFTPYGWYSDDYLLVSKNTSELYILPAAGGKTLKVTDYHRPNGNLRGYGGGYGGL